mgnify:CR=1 FL=1
MYRKLSRPSDLSVSNVRGGLGGGATFLDSDGLAKLCTEPRELVLLVRSSNALRDRCESGDRSVISVLARSRGRGCMSTITSSILC